MRERARVREAEVSKSTKERLRTLNQPSPYPLPRAGEGISPRDARKIGDAVHGFAQLAEQAQAVEAQRRDRRR